MIEYLAGLDVSMEETHLCVLDRDGIVIREGKEAKDGNDSVANGRPISRIAVSTLPFHTQPTHDGSPEPEENKVDFCHRYRSQTGLIPLTY